MEFVSRVLDGSIAYNARGEPLGRSFFGGRISQDDRIDRLEEVSLLDGCSRRQLRAIARISDVVEVPRPSLSPTVLHWSRCRAAPCWRAPAMPARSSS